MRHTCTMCFSRFSDFDENATTLPCGCDRRYLHQQPTPTKTTARPDAVTSQHKPVQAHLNTGGNLQMLFNRGYTTTESLKQNGFKASMMHSKKVCPPHMFGQLYNTNGESLHELGITVFNIATAKWTIAEMKQAGLFTLQDLVHCGLTGNSIRILSYIPYEQWKVHFNMGMQDAINLGCTRETFMEMGWTDAQLADFVSNN